jgi:hypothetical protein
MVTAAEENINRSVLTVSLLGQGLALGLIIGFAIFYLTH